MPSLLQTVQEKFKTAMSQPLTTQMYIAGAAMAPALNRRAIEDKDAIEKVSHA